LAPIEYLVLLGVRSGMSSNIKTRALGCPGAFEGRSPGRLSPVHGKTPSKELLAEFVAGGSEAAREAGVLGACVTKRKNTGHLLVLEENARLSAENLGRGDFLDSVRGKHVGGSNVDRGDRTRDRGKQQGSRQTRRTSHARRGVPQDYHVVDSLPSQKDR